MITIAPSKPSTTEKETTRRGLSTATFGILYDAQQVLAVLALAGGLGEFGELFGVDEFFGKRDLFNARDLQSLSLLQRLYKLRAAQQRVVRAGVEPGDAATHR